MLFDNNGNITKQMCKVLFEPEQRRLTAELQEIVKANIECYFREPSDGFTYKGDVYDRANLVRGPRSRKPLNMSLHQRMDEYLSDNEQISDDKHYVGQILFNLVHRCENWQDLRDILPECVIFTLPELSKYDRLREAAYLINETSQIRQYEKALKRIEFYSMTRMIY